MVNDLGDGSHPPTPALNTGPRCTPTHPHTHTLRQVVLIPEEPEDMWHAYNLVALGDSVKSTTIRKVKDESATGSSTANRVRTTLTLSVEKIEFDTSVCELRVKGRNIQENQYVKVSDSRARGRDGWIGCQDEKSVIMVFSDGCISHDRLAAKSQIHAG